MIALAVWASPALPAAPDQSLRPVQRPGPAAAAETLIDAALMRPSLRPLSEQIAGLAARPETMAFLSPGTSLRPWLRPSELEQKAMARKRQQRKGAVCGDIAIQGDAVGHVPGKIKACGIQDAVRVRSVSGVVLSPPALMNCKTALALREWTDNGLKPAFRQRGPVVEMRVAAHYACRTRNNQAGGRVSEHGKGNAIDLSAFTMKDGEVITVLNGWGKGTTLRPLRRAYNRACGPFGTTLGPDSDGYHKDHFHFDTASYRSGPYCR
ncbi:extensin family protein [Sedimentitalea sp. JM2-8]|uniref:Extensin family protein n=1 Tax=Sedimentitalea xiamensis TaxID=3050037 RepID=A0ABT7FF47_9RHOB|nr:extensin family protein [Sedimentitalea xiamensis]